MRDTARRRLLALPDAEIGRLMAVGGTATNVVRLVPAAALDRVLTGPRLDAAMTALTAEAAAYVALHHAVNPLRAGSCPPASRSSRRSSTVLGSVASVSSTPASAKALSWQQAASARPGATKSRIWLVVGARRGSDDDGPTDGVGAAADPRPHALRSRGRGHLRRGHARVRLWIPALPPALELPRGVGGPLRGRRGQLRSASSRQSPWSPSSTAARGSHRSRPASSPGRSAAPSASSTSARGSSSGKSRGVWRSTPRSTGCSRFASEPSTTRRTWSRYG